MKAHMKWKPCLILLKLLWWYTCISHHHIHIMFSVFMFSHVFRCQKSLNDYLDSKRRIFPRFFFISTDELLSILGSSECSCVQEHMIKVKQKHILKNIFCSDYIMYLVIRLVQLINFSTIDYNTEIIITFKEDFLLDR